VVAAPAGAASTRSAGPSIGAARAYVPTVGAHRSRLVVDISVRYHDARNLAAPAPRGEAISRRSATRRVVARPAQAPAPIAANGSFSLGRDPNGNPFVSGTFGPGPFGGTQVQVAWQSPIGQQACEVLAGNDRASWLSTPLTGTYETAEDSVKAAAFFLEFPASPTITELSIGTRGSCGFDYRNLSIQVSPTGSFQIGQQPNGQPLIVGTVQAQDKILLQCNTSLIGPGNCIVSPGQAQTTFVASNNADLTSFRSAGQAATAAAGHRRDR
jgi:hypothetical protein